MKTDSDHLIIFLLSRYFASVGGASDMGTQVEKRVLASSPIMEAIGESDGEFWRSELTGMLIFLLQVMPRQQGTIIPADSENTLKLTLTKVSTSSVRA